MEKFESLVERLEAVVNSLEKGGVPHAAAAVSALKKDGEDIKAQFFEKEVLSAFNEFEEKAKAINEPAITQITELVIEGFCLDKDVILLAQKCKKPQDKAISALIGGKLRDILGKIKDIKFKHKDFDNHASAVGDGLEAAAWVLTTSPQGFVKEQFDVIDYSGNKVLALKKDDHTQWLKAFKKGVKALEEFISNHFEIGIVWNPNGPDDAEEKLKHQLGESYKKRKGGATSTETGKASAGASQQAPPKAEVKQPEAKKEEAKKVPETQSQENVKVNPLFAQIKSKGEGITQGLKHVEKKSKEEGAGAPAPQVVKKAEKKPAATTQEAKAPKEKVKTLVGGNYRIENFNGDTLEFKEGEADMKTGFFISECSNTMITVKGKIKNIAISNCYNCNILADELVSYIEVINSKKIIVQCLKKLPSVTVDKSETVNIYLHGESKEAQITSAHSSQIVVHFEVKAEDGTSDWTDVGIAEQYITKIVNNKLVTKPAESDY